MTETQALTVLRRVWIGQNTITHEETVDAVETAREMGIPAETVPLTVYLAAAGIKKTSSDYTRESDWSRRTMLLVVDVDNRAAELNLTWNGREYR